MQIVLDIISISQQMQIQKNIICDYFRYNSDILFPYRSPSPRPQPDPTQHPEKEPKRTRNRGETEPNGAETEPNGAEMDRNQAFRGGTGGGFVGVGGVGGCKGKRKSLRKMNSEKRHALTKSVCSF